MKTCYFCGLVLAEEQAAKLKLEPYEDTVPERGGYKKPVTKYAVEDFAHDSCMLRARLLFRAEISKKRSPHVPPQHPDNL